MTNSIQKRTLTFATAMAVALSIAMPAFAKSQSSAPHGEYINNPNGCVTDEGYGRRLPCEAGAS